MNASRTPFPQLDIVTEKNRHRLLLKELLKPELRGKEDTVQITWSGSLSSVESTARSIMVVRQCPVAVIIGATHEEKEDEEQFLDSYVGQVSDGVPYHITVIVPEIESILFHDETVIQALLGRSLSDKEKDIAQTQPYNLLRNILKEQALQQESIDPIVAALRDFVEEVLEAKLPQLDLSRIREIPEIRVLRAFIGDTLTAIPAPMLTHP